MGNTGSGKGGTNGGSKPIKEINVDELDDAIRTCVAVCRAIYNHAVEVGFSGGQGMILATTYMRAMLIEGK